MTPADAAARAAAARRLLVALDFDGTVSPFEDDPMRSRMLPAARTAVSALTATTCTWVALVSGRSLPDLRVIAEHDDRSPVLLAGSHGAEYWTPGDGVHTDPPDRARSALRDRLEGEARAIVAGLPGVRIEPKSFGFGVHTRRAAPADARVARDRADALMRAQAPDWRRRTGQDILEYAYRQEGKDAAVAWLRRRTDADVVLFAGDDTTDEDALRTLGPADVGVHVGPAAETAASVIVADIPSFAAMLADLADRRRSRGAIDCGHA